MIDALKRSNVSRIKAIKVLLILLLGCLTVGALAQTPAEYADLPGRKAMAAVPGHSDTIYGIGHSQLTDTGAADVALKQCQLRLVQQSAEKIGSGQACEVVNLNNENITTGAEILVDGGLC